MVVVLQPAAVQEVWRQHPGAASGKVAGAWWSDEA